MLIDRQELLATRASLHGYAEWVQEYVDRDFVPYLLTFHFKPMRGGRKSQWARMERELRRFYATLLTRIVRDPLSRESRDLPFLMAAPDLPVPKHAKQPLQRVKINDGFHSHGAYMVPPNSRMRRSLKDHVNEHRHLYAGRQHGLLNVQVDPINTDPEYVTAYALKSISRGRFGLDDIIIFPKAKSELSRKDQHETRH